VLRNVGGYLNEVYKSERTLSDVMDTMIEDLEDAEVKAMM
jgi:hypothetical protein